jgi:hypothetical protein
MGLLFWLHHASQMQGIITPQEAGPMLEDHGYIDSQEKKSYPHGYKLADMKRAT